MKSEKECKIIDVNDLENVCIICQQFIDLQRKYWLRKVVTWKWSYVAVTALSYFILKQIAANSILPNISKALIICVIGIVLVWFTLKVSKLIKDADLIQHKFDTITGSYLEHRFYLEKENNLNHEQILEAKAETVAELKKYIDIFSTTRKIDKAVRSDYKANLQILESTEINAKRIEFNQLKTLFEYQALITIDSNKESLRSIIIEKIMLISDMNYKNVQMDKYLKYIFIVLLGIYIVTLFVSML